MCLHAVNAALHDDAAVEFEHVEAFFDDVTTAFCCEMLILEFLLEALDGHPVHAFHGRMRA